MDDRDLAPAPPRTYESEPGRTAPLRPSLPMGRDPQSIRQRIEMMEMILERSFTVPGSSRTFGMDSIIGLIPVIGDFVSAGLGAYIVWEARNLGVPKWKIWRMAGNIAFDTAVGAVPVAGDLFDFLYKSNTKNLRIIKKHLDKHHPETRVIDG